MKIPKEWYAVIIHVALILLASLMVFLTKGREAGLTLCAGGVVSLLTLVGVVWTIRRMMAKKPIALTGLSIVIKYALLGGILFYLTQVLELNVLWLGLGVATILPSLFVFSILSEKGLDEADEDI